MLSMSLISLLSSNAISSRRDKSILYARSGIITMIVCGVICFSSYDMEFLKNGLGLYHGLFHNSAITHGFHLFIFIVTGLILQLNSFYPRKIWTSSFSSISDILFNKLVYYNTYILNKMGGQYNILEYPLIILFVVTGGSFLITCSDIISVFLAIELQSYGLYILCSVYKESEKATSAGLTYFLLGGLSSCFILFASSLLYSNSGNTSFDGIYIINNIAQSYTDSYLNTVYNSHYINFAFAIMSIGFLFKVTAAPFHFWSPDVYDAIPTVVTTFVAIFAKISIFVLMLELVYYTSSFSNVGIIGNINNSFTDSITEYKTSHVNNAWKYTLVLSAVSSFIIGSILGMTQFRIKRLYAYSTISHVGFILLALSINSIESIQSFIFYLMQYSLSNLNAFIILLAMGYSLYIYVEKDKDDMENTIKGINQKSFQVTPIISDKSNSPIQLISQLKGYFYINPTLAISFTITIFSFVGIPPLIGFFGKQMVLSAALDNGYVFVTLIAILTSVISGYYYLSLVKQIFFNKSDYEINGQIKDLKINSNIINLSSNTKLNSITIDTNNIVLSSALTVTISLLTLGILLFMLNPQEWLSMINILSLILYNN